MDLIEYLPSFYFNSEEVKNIQESMQSEDNSVKDAIQDVLNQMFIDTATWGLNWWEKLVGLDIDLTKTYIFRRERIKAKIRGAGTVTNQLIKDVAISYSNGEVEVTEDSANYSFNIKFVGVKGIPGNMSDLILTIEEIKPAHLAFTFEYTWITWDEFDNFNKTFDEWDALNLTWDDFETYKEVV